MKLYRRWRHVSRHGNPHAYPRRMKAGTLVHHGTIEVGVESGYIQSVRNTLSIEGKTWGTQAVTYFDLGDPVVVVPPAHAHKVVPTFGPSDQASHK